MCMKITQVEAPTPFQGGVWGSTLLKHFLDTDSIWAYWAIWAGDLNGDLTVHHHTWDSPGEGSVHLPVTG